MLLGAVLALALVMWPTAVSNPEASSPAGANPAGANPAASNPAAQPTPAASNPAASNPAASNPAASNPAAQPTPAASNPEASNPEASNPEASNPEASNPEASNPEASNPEASNQAVRALAARLATSGVRVQDGPGEVRVVFDGLFTGGDRLSPAGAAALREFGRKLTGVATPVTVVGHVVAVPGGPVGGGSVVGMGRALVAARELAAASGLPLTAFVMSSADQSDRPTGEPRRDRTVSLTVRPAVPAR